MRQATTLVILLLALSACRRDKTDDGSNPNNDCASLQITDTTDVKGFGILDKLPGIWNGPVYSPTPLGSYPEWIVDFRPISASTSLPRTSSIH